VTTGIVVLHDMGDADAGEPWRAALRDVRWPGPVVAPDLPGHGTSPAPVGGSYELADPAIWAVRYLAEAGPEPPVVVGIGINGWAASIVALAGRASRLVLVDGLGGPWTDPWTAIFAGRDWLRAIADDPAAIAPAPPSGLDPRLRHGVPLQTGRAIAHRAAVATNVPVLVIETPASGLAPDDRDGLLASYTVPVDLRALTACDPDAVATEIARWAAVPAA
jgi:pimeloyl-ACP methyl ester carboxylesterase